MASKQLVSRLGLQICATDTVISSVSGQRIRPLGQVTCQLTLQNRTIPDLTLLVLPELPSNSMLLIGMDVMRRVGGMTLHIGDDERIRFSVGASAVKCPAIRPLVTLTDDDYEVSFDGQKWEAAWKWKDKVPTLRNRVPEYAVAEGRIREKYIAELRK